MADNESLQSLATRAQENVQGEDHWKPLVSALSNPWSPTSPEGM